MRSTVRIVGTLFAVAVGTVAVIAAVWFWEENPTKARLASIALLLAFGGALSLGRWKAAPKNEGSGPSSVAQGSPAGRCVQLAARDGCY